MWGIDLTHIRLNGGWLYLVAILDWFSRFMLAWELDQTLGMPCVLTTMQSALGTAIPEVCNSDQGSHFTSPQWAELLQGADVRISMDGKGRAGDNAFVERLWRSVKDAKVYRRDYRRPRQARQGLCEYFASARTGGRTRPWAIAPRPRCTASFGSRRVFCPAS